MLQNVLRRQSLFKLKEKINGKVSKQISEIERRKLSPYRFSNSPLKQKKEQSTSKLAKPNKRHVNELPVSKLTEIPEEQYVVKASASKTNIVKEKLSTTIATDVTSPFRRLDNKKTALNSPTSHIRAAANKFFYKKFSKARNVKRLNATTQGTGSPYANENTENCPNRSLQQNSPDGKRFISKWKCQKESVNL